MYHTELIELGQTSQIKIRPSPLAPLPKRGREVPKGRGEGQAPTQAMGSLPRLRLSNYMLLLHWSIPLQKDGRGDEGDPVNSHYYPVVCHKSPPRHPVVTGGRCRLLAAGQGYTPLREAAQRAPVHEPSSRGS